MHQPQAAHWKWLLWGRLSGHHSQHLLLLLLKWLHNSSGKHQLGRKDAKKPRRPSAEGGNSARGADDGQAGPPAHCPPDWRLRGRPFHAGHGTGAPRPAQQVPAKLWTKPDRRRPAAADGAGGAGDAVPRGEQLRPPRPGRPEYSASQREVRQGERLWHVAGSRPGQGLLQGAIGLEVAAQVVRPRVHLLLQV